LKIKRTTPMQKKHSGPKKPERQTSEKNKIKKKGRKKELKPLYLYELPKR
jgi:hypothetical protein